jgi:PAS domain-containing protein
MKTGFGIISFAIKKAQKLQVFLGNLHKQVPYQYVGDFYHASEPVTHREYVLADHETIVSKTDLQGNITYVNDEFIRISGFTEEELIGAPEYCAAS